MAVTNDFTGSELDLNGVIGIGSPTALVWGADGRLYVTEQDGDIKILTVAFGDSDVTDGDDTNSFYVTDAELITDVKTIPNHNDDGTNSANTVRQVTGIDVTQQYDAGGNAVMIDGKPAVVMYVTSSDSRIGAGGSGNDADLDTNSGMITRLTQTETGWDVVDIVRGLARSEENHATNGLEVIQEVDANTGLLVSERLIVANGGNANTGAPSNNFAGQQEQPYSAAILEVDLTEIRAIEAAGVKTDGTREYVYDLPTLDDPTRDAADDGTDPFGGNDGLNSAKLIFDSPVQIYSAGYRNAFDVEVTDDGRVFTYDNGANNNWGGRPAGEDEDGDTDTTEPESGTRDGYIATNLFVEDNSDVGGNFNPQNWDQLHEVTRSDDLAGRSLSAGEGGVQTYAWDHPDHGELTLVYGGHPNPTRAEGARAGILYTPNNGVGDAKLLVSNVAKSDGNGGFTSDFLEVVAWFDTIGYSETFINETVVALDPGVRYSDSFASGFGAAARPTVPGVFSLEEDPAGAIGLPSDIDEIVFQTNSIEGNYLEAGFTDGALDTGKGSVNGLTEYTSSIFDDAGQGAMQGALIAASLNQAEYYIIGREADGTVETTTASGAADPRTIAADREFLSSGGAPLGLASIGDDLIPHGGETAFQGTLWAAIYKQNGPVIEIFQPGNPDDNNLLGTNNYAGQVPSDPTDHDLDGVDHLNDPFEFDADNGLSLTAGQQIILNFSQVDLASTPEFSGTLGDTGLLGAALDGVTPNRDAKTELDGFTNEADREDGLFDNAGNIIPGGNAPILQIKQVQDGSALNGENDLLDALHTGVKIDDDVERLVAEVDIFNWYADQPGGGRISGVTFGDGTQSNFVRFVFGDVNGSLGLEVGIEVNDVYTVLGTSTDAAFIAAVGSAEADANQKIITLQLEVSDIGGNYALAANFKVVGETEFQSVSLSNPTLPVGVLRDVLDGTHTISDGDTTLSSGAAIGIVAEKDDGVSFTSVDIAEIRIDGIGNEVVATTEAEAEAAGTDGVDTILYTGDAAAIALDDTIENFDGSGSTANWEVEATTDNNVITAGEGVNTITTRDGEDAVVGTKTGLDGDEITDFSFSDKVVITDATAADATGVTYTAGSAVLNVNGTIITFSGPEFENFDPATGPSQFAFNEGDNGLEITRVPEESVLYRVNAGGATIAATDDGPDWTSDADFFNGAGPVNITGTVGSTYTNGLTDAEDEITYTNDVNPNEVPWELFVHERSENVIGGAELTYNFDVEVGKTYKITLLYAENWNNIFASTSPRIFDVEVEGSVPTAFDDIHPLRDATDFVDGAGAALPTFGNGSQATKQPYLGVATQREFTFTATDDTLNLAFQHSAASGVQNPKINAIQITQIGFVAPAVDDTPPVVASVEVEDSLSDQDSPRLVTVTITDDTALDVAGLADATLAFTGITPASISAPVVTLAANQQSATLVYTIDPPADTSAWPTGDFSVAVASFADAADNNATSASFDFTFADPPQPGEVVFALNAGGGAIDGEAYGLPGVTFEADTAAAPNATVDFSSNTTGSAAAAGNNTNNNGTSLTFSGEPVPDTVFTSERWGDDFSYNVDLPNGSYAVDLYFAETFQGVPGGNVAGGVGSRSFDALIEGETVLDDYDLFDDGDGTLGDGTGAPAVKIIKTFDAIVTDGTLTITFDAKQDGGEIVADNAKISAFVVRIPDVSGPTVSISGDETVTEDAGMASYTVTLSEAVTEATSITVDLSAASFADVPGDAEVTGGGTQLTLNFVPGGALSQDFTVDVLDDTLPEVDESFAVSVSGLPVTSGGAGNVTTVISANDGAVDSVNGTPVIGGDLSDDGATPTDLGTLAQGDTVVVANQQGDSEPGGRERDYFTFTVAEGDVLTGIMLDDWQTAESGSPQAFIAIQQGDAVTVDPTFFTNAEDLLGGYIYNSGDVANAATNLDGNLLTRSTLGAGNAQGIQFLDTDGDTFGDGFDGPLPAGTYTIWLNQGGDISTATLRLVTEEFKEVVTIALGASETAVENGDFGTTEVGFALAASDNFSGDITIVFDAAEALGQSQVVTFTDGVGRLAVDVANDTIDNGIDEVSLVQFVSGTTASGDEVVDFAPIGADATTTVTEDDGPLIRGDVVAAFNAGGLETLQDGITFAAAAAANNGNPFTGGSQFTDSNGGNGQQPIFDGTVFETEINDGGDGLFSFSAAVPDPSKQYFVDLYFAEIFTDVVGGRIFNVFAEDGAEPVLENFDVVATTGDADVGYVAQLADPISAGANGTIDLSFVGVVDRAKVSGIVFREVEGAPDVTVSVQPTTVSEDAGQADAVFTRLGDLTEELTLTFTVTDDTALDGVGYTVPVLNTVTFAAGAAEAVTQIAILDNDVEAATQTTAFNVTITGATVPSGGPISQGTGTAAVTITDDEFVDPADIDSDGILNTDDPFAFDGSNGNARVLGLGEEFRQDFNVDSTDPFSVDAGFSGILVNPAFDYPDASAEDPYGNRTSGAPGVEIANGTLSITSSDNDANQTGTGTSNTLIDGYQSAVNVVGLTTFEVSGRAKSDDFFATATSTSGFENFGITLGAGGVDDYIKLVISDTGNGAQRVQLAHNGSLVGGEFNYPVGGTGPSIDLSTVGYYGFTLLVDRSAGVNGQIAGRVDFFSADDDTLITSFDVPPVDILADSNLLAAMDGANPLTGGDGGLAYGVFVTDSGANASNRITVDFDYLAIRATDPIDLSIVAPAVAVVEAGDAGTTTLDFALNAPGFTGVMDVEFTVNGTPTTASDVAFTDGLATLTVDVANDDLANGDTAVSVVLTGTNNASVTVDGAPADGILTDDDAAPVGVADTTFTFEDTPIIFDPSANDTDTDTDAANVVVSGVSDVVTDGVAADEATVELNVDGTVTVTPLNGYVGPIAFNYTVTDGTNTSFSSALVTVTAAALVGITNAPTKIETGDTGSVTLVFPITTQPAVEGSVEVSYTVDGGVAVTETVTFDAAGQATLSVSVANDDAVDVDDLTDVVLTTVNTNGFKLDAANSAAQGRIIEDDDVSLDIMVNEDVEVGNASDPYELSAGVETIDTSGSAFDTNIVGNDEDNTFTVGAGQDTIDLQEDGGADSVAGTAAALDGTVIANADEDDEVVITDATAASVILSTQEGSTIVTVDLDGSEATTDDQTTITFAEDDLTATLDENGVLKITQPAAQVFRIQAEDFDSSIGYGAQSQIGADSGNVAFLPDGGATGTATYDLGGTIPPGIYTITVGYFDENDGVSTIGLSITSDETDAFSTAFDLDEITPSGTANAQTFRTQTFAGVEVGANGVLVLNGTSNAGESARVDFFEFEKVVDPDNGSPYLPFALEALQTDENAAFSVDLGAAFVDDEEDALTFSATADTADGGLPAGLTLIDGVLSGTPTVPGVYEISVTASDNNTFSAPATFTLTINDVNTPPEVVTPIADQFVNVNDAVNIDFGAAFDDQDGDTLTYTLDGALPVGLVFNATEGTITGTALDAAGSYQVTITADDQLGGMVSESFIFNLTGGVVQDPIRIEAEDADTLSGFFIQNSTKDRLRTLANKEASATFNLDDVPAGDYIVRIGYWDEADGDSTLGLSVVSGDVETEVGSFVLDDDDNSSNAATAASFRVKTLDNPASLVAGDSFKLAGKADGGEFLRIDYIELVPVNDLNFAPTETEAGIADIDLSGLLAVEANIADAFSDPEEDALTFAIADGPDWLAVDPATGALSGTPTAPGTYVVTVSAEDAGNNAGILATSQFTINVAEPVSNAPVLDFAIAPITVDQDGFVEESITFTDPEGGLVSYSLAEGAPDWINVDQDGTLSGTPDADDITDDLVVTVIATDPQGASAFVDIPVTVNNVNDAPEVGTPLESQSATLGLAFNYALPTDAFTDADTAFGDTLTYSAALANGDPLPTWLAIDPNTGALSGIPDLASDLAVVVTATDADGLSVSAPAITIDLSAFTVPTDAIQIEAEDFSGLGDADNYAINNLTAASGSQIIRMPADSLGVVTQDLSEYAGSSFKVAVTYIDETDGVSTGRVLVDGQELGSWAFDGAQGTQLTPGGPVGNFVQAGNYRTVELDTVVGITSDSVLTLEVQSQGGEFGRIDYITLVPAALPLINEAPTAVTVTPLAPALPEDTDTTVAVKVADITVTDDILGTNDLTIAGADADSFEIVGTELFLKAGAVLDFETKPTLDISVQVDDAEVGDLPFDAETAFSLAIADVNEAPLLAVTPVISQISQDADTTAATKVADIVVTDDALGTYALTLTGDDAALFEIVTDDVTMAMSLNLVAGASLDVAGNAQLDVNVVLDDPEIGVAVAEAVAPVAITVVEGDVVAGETVVLRINAFGDTIAATDGGPDWQADLKDDALTAANENNVYLNIESAVAAQDRGDVQGYTGDTGLLPSELPQAVLDTARSGDFPFSYDIPVGDIGGPGDFEVKLYFAELFEGNQVPNNRIFDIQIEGSSPGQLNDFDPSTSGGGDLSAISYDVTVVDGELNIRFAHDAINGADNPIINAIEIVRKGDVVTGPTDGQALVTANEGATNIIGSSTFVEGSLKITNESTNDVSITRVVIDLSDTMIPDIAFDTRSAADGGPIGDPTSKPFDQGTASVGFTPAPGNGQIGGYDYTVTMGGQVIDPVSGGVGDNLLILEFAPGEFAVDDVLAFSIDIDPFTATVGAIGGAVAGFEIAGASVTVDFDDGSTATSVVTPVDGTVEGRALVKAGQVDLGAPTLTLGDGTTAARVVNQDDLPITVDAGVENAGGTARVFILDTAFVSNGDSASINPPGDGIQGNNAQTEATVVEVQLDANGQFNGTIPLTRSTTQEGNANGNLGFNYFSVGVVDANGEVTQTSDALVVEFDPSANVPTIGDGGGTEPGDVLLRINAFGDEIAVADGPNWQADTVADTSPYFSGTQNRGDNDATPATPNLADVPNDIFATARSDDGTFSYDIPVSDLPGITAGDTVTVNLYFAEAANLANFDRIFDVQLEGVTAINDLNPTVTYGVGGGGVVSTVVQVTGDTLNIDFLNNNVENAIVNGIEIVEGGLNPINGGGVIDPPADPTDALEILGVADGDFDGVVQGQVVDNTNDGGTNGSVVLTIMDGEETVDASNFGGNSFQLTNTGNKEVAAVFVDIRNAVFADQVFDIDGTGGDTAAKTFQINGDDGTGAYFVGDNKPGSDFDNLFFEGDTPAADTSGESANNGNAPVSGGFRGLLVRFDGSNGGFDGGETVGFSGDGDSNSIAGFASGTLNPNNVTSSSFDTGGQSGSELVGSSFTVLFADGTTATGYLGSDTSNAGAAGEAVQGRATSEATLSVDTGSGIFASGEVGTYGGSVPTITVSGTAGDVVRVTLHKGFQPTDGPTDEVAEVIQGRLDTLVPNFAVNNAFDVQTVDVTIGAGGTAQIAASAFDYINTTTGETFPGDDVQPLALTAAVVVPVTDSGAIAGSGESDLVPVGPVSQPVYLSNPTGTPVDDSVVVDPAPDGYFAINGSGNNAYFKIQIEDENGTGGTNPGGKWNYLTEGDELGNQTSFQGDGYYLFGSDVSKGIDRDVGGNETLEYTIFVSEDDLGTYDFSFLVSRDDRVDPNPNDDTDPDGTFPGDQQNDLWLNFKHAEDAGNGDIAEFLTGNGSNVAEPDQDGFIKLFGGPSNGNFGNANQIDGLPGNFGAEIEITEAGLYTIQVDGRSQGYHVDYFELYKDGNNPGGGSANSTFITGDPVDPIDPGDGGGGEPTGDPIRIQAEDFDTETGGYVVQSYNSADAGELIGIAGDAGTAGAVTYDLSDAGIGAGTYDVKIVYVDENDGEVTLNVDVGNANADIVFDDDANSTNGVNAQNYREATIADVLVNGSDTLTLSSVKDGDEYARVDYIEFIQTDGGGNTGGGASQTVVTAIDASTDDTEEFGGSGSTDLEFGMNGPNAQFVGLRFDGIDIPEGAEITDAFFRFEAFESQTGAASFTIEIEDNENAQTYSDGNDPDDRDYVSDEFVWNNVEAWTDGNTYRTPDLTALIEDLIGTNGDVSDGAFAFRIEGSGSRVAHSFNSSGNAPELVIVYDEFDPLTGT